MSEDVAANDRVDVRFGEVVRYFVKLGTIGFGGPIALAGYMQKDLVEDRRWYTKEEYLDGLALAQLAPGPLAAQLAMYLGWVRGGVVGATVVGVAFVLPSFLMVLVLSELYLRFGGLSWMQGAFYGVGAAVIALVARSAQKLVKLTLAKDRLLWAIFVVNGAVTAVSETELASIVIASGLVVLLVRAPPNASSASPAIVLPAWLVTGLSGPASTSMLGQIFLTFIKAGAVVFGSGLAIVPFLRGAVVEEQRWLTEQQFLDAVAVAMITPGPVVITVAFIGHLTAGVAGAVVAAIGTFLPCWAFVVLPARWFHRVKEAPRVKAFVVGVTAAATGSIAGAAVVLGRRALIDVPTVLLCVLTLLAVTKTKIKEPLVIVAAALIGMAIRSLLELR